MFYPLVSTKLARISNHRHVRGFQNSIEQMVAFGQQSSIFPERHDQGIDLAPQAVLSSGNIFNDILETHFSDNEQVNIAFRAGPAASEPLELTELGDRIFSILWLDFSPGKVALPLPLSQFGRLAQPGRARA